MLENEIDADGGAALVTASEVRHYFVMAGYVMDLDRHLKFKPSMMLRVVKGAPLSLDLNANFLLRVASVLGSLKIESRGTQNHKFTMAQFRQRYETLFGAFQ